MNAMARREQRASVASLPRVTIVTPVYNEEASLSAYREAVSRLLISRDDVHFEVLFVDDGSEDRSWQIIESFCRESPRFRGLRLSRNFGAHVALSAGIDHAGGDAVATLACDLQDAPETLLAFVEKWCGGADIVWGHRRTRDERRGRVWVSNVFFRLIRLYAMPRGSKFTTGSFFLIDRAVADCFRQFREQHRVTFALVAWTGFDQDIVYYDRRARHAGSSGWTFGLMVKAMYDTFIGFSNLPPRLFTLTGAILFLLNIPFTIYLVIDFLFFNPMPGWTGIMCALSAFFGVAFLMLGMMSEYLHRIYLETSRRPLYFISKSSGLPATDYSNRRGQRAETPAGELP
jgi:glycosyltransferase involved in cell wall biosynthesis